MYVLAKLQVKLEVWHIETEQNYLHFQMHIFERNDLCFDKSFIDVYSPIFNWW